VLGSDGRIYVLGGDTGSTNERSGVTARVDRLGPARPSKFDNPTATGGGAGSSQPHGPMTAPQRSSPTTPPAKTAPEATDTRTFVGRRFSIDYPSSSRIVSGEAPMPGFVDTTISDPADGTATTNIRVDYTPSVHTSAEVTAAQQRVNHRSNAPGYREISYAPTELAGRPAIRWEFEELQAHVRVRKVDTFVIDREGHRGFAVLTQARATAYPRLEATYERLLASFLIESR
jgi:hypothetical protein